MNQAIDIVQSAAKQGKAGGQMVPQLLVRRASIDTALGEAAAAEDDAKAALDSLRARLPPDEVSAAYGRAYLALARALKAEGKAREARSAGQEAVRQLKTTLGQDHPDTRAAQALSEGLEAPPS